MPSFAVELKNKGFLGPIFCLCLIIALFSLKAYAEKSYAPYSSINIPPMSIKTITGEPFSFKSIKGKAFLLNFWASWCAPCREEFPDLISAVKWSKGRLALVAISNDSSKKDIMDFLKSIKKAGVKWRQKDVYILWDKDFKVARQFNVAKWPETFIVDPTGRMVKKQAGAFSFQQSKPFLSRLLGQSRRL